MPRRSALRPPTARPPRPAAWPGAALLVSALLLAGCSRAPEPVAPAVAVAAAPAATSIDWRKPQSEAETDAVLAEARARGLPVFVYWGAVWCPPCNQLKSTLFRRPDFIAQTRAFVPVYLDGDLPGAQKLGARFKVSGYPTTVLLGRDGVELTRLPGAVDPQQYLQLLALGLEAQRPVKALLAAAEAPAGLTPAEWRMLAQYDWAADRELPKAGRAALLDRLAAACPAEQADAALRLRLQALLAHAAEGATGQAPGAAATRERVQQVLADPARIQAHLDWLLYSADDLVPALAAAGTPERAALAAAWADQLDRLAADTQLTQAQRIGALGGQVALAKLDAPASAALQARVREQAARADREVSDPMERQSVITSAAYALAQAGLIDESDRLLQAELTRSFSPYYAMAALASNAKRRGDRAAALDWHERAYAASVGPATRVQWGASYVGALIELAPDDASRIAGAAAAVLRELEAQPDAFYERSADGLARMSQRLLAWQAGAPARAEVLTRLRAQRDGLCAALPAADPQRATCERLLAPPAA